MAALTAVSLFAQTVAEIILEINVKISGVDKKKFLDNLYIGCVIFQVIA